MQSPERTNQESGKKEKHTPNPFKLSESTRKQSHTEFTNDLDQPNNSSSSDE